MATRKTRTARARSTEAHVAERLRDIYPQAARVPASIPGPDILNTPGIAVEVKARRDFQPTTWLNQASRNAPPGVLPVVVLRPDGYGPERIESWGVLLPLWAFMKLLEERKDR